MTSLVTGATGFIGGRVVEALLARGEAVRALVRNPAKWASPAGVELVAGDTRDPALVREAVAGADVVYHCAAATGEGLDRAAIYATTLEGTRHVLEALRQAGRGRLVLLGGLSVLGLRNLKEPAEDYPYRRSGDPDIDVKIDTEQLARTYHDEHGVDVTFLRAGFVYGPQDRRNLPQLTDALRRGGFLYIGSRHNVVPLVHVEDMARALVAAGRAPAARGRVYHIAEGTRTTIGELVTHLAGLLGCPPPVRTLPYVLPYSALLACEGISRLLGRPVQGPLTRSGLLFLGTSRCVDISRAKQELGYEPKITYREGLAGSLPTNEEPHHEPGDPALTSA
jgi:nucleoside-diphosphate-sugar epimerase